MSLVAKIYVSIVVLTGAWVAAWQLSHWQSDDLVRFGCYFLLSIIASRLKVTLPGIGSLSVLFMFILFGVVELRTAEALCVGCAAILVHCYWHYRQRPQWHQALFNVFNTANAIAASSYAYHSAVLNHGYFDVASKILVATIVFFTVNTFPVAVAISLTERKSLRQVWRECYFWSFPY